MTPGQKRQVDCAEEKDFSLGTTRIDDWCGGPQATQQKGVFENKNSGNVQLVRADRTTGY